MFIYRVWFIVSGFVTVSLIPFYFENEDLGVYFTFLSLIGIQVFFELGLNQLIQQRTSVSVAHIEKDLQGFCNPSEYLRSDTFVGIVKFVKKIYPVIALAFCAICVSVGVIFIERSVSESKINIYISVWILLSMSTALNLWMSPQLAIYEGCGFVAEVSKLRLYQSIIGNVAQWIFLYLFGTIWVILFVPISSAFLTYKWINKSHIIPKVNKKLLCTEVVWARDIFPTQWRMAISWISGYFIGQLFTPIFFKYFGQTSAGQYGLTMSIYSAILTIGMSLLYSKMPILAMLVERNDLHHMRLVFRRSLVISFGIVLFLTSVVTYIMNFGLLAKYGLSDKFLDPTSVTAIFGITLCNSVIYGVAIYARSFGGEPMVKLSAVLAILVVISLTFLHTSTIQLILFTYFIILLCVALPWLWFIYQKTSLKNG